MKCLSSKLKWFCHFKKFIDVKEEMKHKDIDTQALHHNGHKHIINIEHCIKACVTLMGLKTRAYTHYHSCKS